MRRFAFLPLFALAVLPFVETLVAQQPKAGVNYAFLVAPAEYDKNELRPLPFSASETEEFRQVLLKTGFEERNIKFLHDKAIARYLPERKKIVEEFELLLSRARPEDTVVVLLNGHGVQYAGDKFGYFCPVDAKLTDRKTLWAMDGPGGVYDLLKGCKAKRKVLLANACRNDPRSDRSLAGDKIEIVDDYAEAVPEGIAALYSCAAGEKSYYYDPDDARTKGRKRSLYMHHLIEAWGQETTTIEEVFRKVSVGASADADDLFRRKQNPIPRREYKGDGEWTIRASVAVAPPSKERKGGDEVEFEIADGVMMKFCWIPPGEAQLGSPKAEREAVTKQLVEAKLAKEGEEPEWLKAEGARGKYVERTGFWLGKYPVTQGEWTAVMGEKKEWIWFRKDGEGADSVKGLDTSRFPAERVSWDDAQEFLGKVNGRVGVATAFGKGAKLVLPHEDRWEYAYRGNRGNGRAYYWGDSLNGDKANCDGNYPFGTTDKGEYLERPTAVGSYESKAKHPWGLCDLSGNVYQWCENKYSNDSKGRVLRGGSWFYDARRCRAALRSGDAPGARDFNFGFRVCVVLD